jgi:hypothetical protein
MYEQNCFITLTYSDDHIGNNRLIKEHFQTFINDLRGKVFRKWLKHIGKSEDWYAVLPKDQRKKIYEPIEIPYFATGEYGDKSKRMHWHAILFNFRPDDLCYKYSTELGHKVYTSKFLEEVWPYGNLEVAQVSFESAGYVARYSAKKLVHGNDQDHDFTPIHLRSKKHAIGKKWLEKFYKTDCFNQGFIVLDNGARVPIPRYYTKWLKDHHPEHYGEYVTGVRARAQKRADHRAEKIKKEEMEVNEKRRYRGDGSQQISRNQVRKAISESKFKKLQKHQKGDF